MYTEPTPNPLALKFILGQPVVDQGTYLLSSAQEASHIPVLNEILLLPGIVSIVVSPEFLSITKTEAVAWTLLESIILSILHHHWGDFPLQSQSLRSDRLPIRARPGAPENASLAGDALDPQTTPAPDISGVDPLYRASTWQNWVPPTPDIAALMHDIEALVDEMVRPAVEADGGMLTVCGFQEGIVYVLLQGACTSCPHSQDTLKGGVENTLRHYIPDVVGVEMVLDGF